MAIKKTILVLIFFIFISAPSFAAVGDALDNTALVWTTGASAINGNIAAYNPQWTEQIAVTHDGVDAMALTVGTTGSTAECGVATNPEYYYCTQVWIETTVTGPGVLNFWQKVSSEGSWEYLRFYIDGVEQAPGISGEIDWQEKNYTIAAGVHTLKWSFTRDYCCSGGSSTAWLDTVTFGAPTLGDAVDNTTLVWATSGNANWFPQTTTFYSGGDAAQSGVIGPNQTSSISTTVTGMGTGSFYWKVSSQINNDYLRFYIDGVEQVSIPGISGEVGWVQKTFTITTLGIHTLRWSYVKAAAGSAGSDAGWLDSVTFNAARPDIGDAVDMPSWMWISSGNVEWLVDFGTYYSDFDSARSGMLTAPGQSTSVFTTVTGPGFLKFHWKVSSDGWSQYLKFYIDGVEQGAPGITGWVDWQEQTYLIGSGTHEVKWTYIIEPFGWAGGWDMAWLDNVRFDPITLGEAVDDTTLIWATSGNANWFGQTDFTYSGGDAAQSGDINDIQSSTVSTTVTGLGTISFYWKVSSEVNDYLRFYIDGVEQPPGISGNVDWTVKTFTIPTSGAHTLQWTYSKDGSVSNGSDAGYLDSVVWTPLTIGEAVDNTALAWATSGNANWTGQFTTSFSGGDAAQSGAIGNGQSSIVQTTVIGPGDLSFYWKVSSELGGDFLRFYIDGALQTSISGEMGWEQKTYVILSGTHTLKWVYVTNGSILNGSNAAWLDDVAFSQIGDDYKISSGDSHTAAIKSNGTLWAWGANWYGQLGTGNTNTYNSPTQVGAVTTWNAVSAGQYHTVALRTNRTLWAWGLNSAGQLGNATNFGSWNANFTPIQIAGTWQSVSAGGYYTVGIKSDGTLWAWGENWSGQLGTGVSSAPINSPTQIGVDTDWVSVATGYDHTIALKADGTLWAWGSNWAGQLGDGTTNWWYYSPVQIGVDTTWAAISAGYAYTTAIKSDGTLWAWGYNWYGQLGTGDTADRWSPTQIGTDTNWQAVSAGDWYHTVALKSNRTLWAWGLNADGQIGNVTNYGTWNANPTPTQIGADTTWTAVAAGGYHSAGIKSGRTLWSWGSNWTGQVGDGTWVGVTTPTQSGIATTWGSSKTVPTVVSGPTASSLKYGVYVDSPFTITARFNENNSTMRSCGYSLDNGSTWTAGVITGSGATTDCTVTTASCADASPLTILMKAENGVGFTTTLSISQTCDASGPATGVSFTASSGVAVGSGICSLAWTAASDVLSGLNLTQPYELRYQPGTDPISCAGGTQVYIGTGLSTTHIGLTNGTTYYYRLCYKDNVNNQSEYSANPITCVPKTQPTVTTASATSIRSLSATLNGSANAEGALTDVWFEWGDDPTLTTYNTTTPVSIGAGSADVPASDTVSWLVPLTTLYYRTAASNSEGTVRGTISTIAIPTPIFVSWSGWTSATGNYEIYVRRSIDGASTWDEDRITTNAGKSITPAIARSGANVYAVWSDTWTYGNYEIMFNKSTDTGATWGTPARFTTLAGTSATPQVAASGANVYVVWAEPSYGNYEIAFRKSTDSGATWGAIQRLTTTAGKSLQPRIAIDGANIYVAWGDTTYGNSEAMVVRPADSGVTWQALQRITTNLGYSMSPSVAASGSNVYLVWQDNTSSVAAGYAQAGTLNTITLAGTAASTNDYYTGMGVYIRSGTGYGQTRTISAYDGTTKVATVSSNWATIPSSTSIYRVGPGNDSEVLFVKSTDSGATWSTLKWLTLNTGYSQVPVVGVNGSDVFIAWSDTTPGNAEIYTMKSSDSGSTWGASDNISNTYNVVTKTGRSVSPSFAVNNTEAIVVWQDDFNQSISYNDIFLKRSTDGGLNWQSHDIATTAGNHIMPAMCK